MSFPAGSNIQVMEKAKRRRNADRGRKCAKGTIPQVYNMVKAPVQETRVIGLGNRLKALWAAIKERVQGSRS